MSGIWQSARLLYRSLEKDDEPFLETLGLDSEAFMNSAPFLPIPQGKKQATAYREFLEAKLLNAVICLPAATDTTAESDNNGSKSTPVGLINLAAIDPRQIQHRRTELGVNIARRYQGQGFGTEAIKWALDWAFRYAGLHRIEINAFTYNEGALKLYERIGFVQEGRKRDFVYHDGKFWDAVSYSMLEDEWRKKFAIK